MYSCCVWFLLQELDNPKYSVMIIMAVYANEALKQASEEIKKKV